MRVQAVVNRGGGCRSLVLNALRVNGWTARTSRLDVVCMGLKTVSTRRLSEAAGEQTRISCGR